MEHQASEAREFIASIELKSKCAQDARNREFAAHIDVKRVTIGDLAVSAYDATQNEAQVVGSSLLAFVAGVDTDVRDAISDAMLLAQGYASQKIDFQKDPQEWYRNYSLVLQNAGWLIQDQQWNVQAIEGEDAEVHQQIAAVLAVALAAAPTAAAIAMASIKALHDADSGSPWITIFNREAKQSHLARFQVGAAAPGPGGGAVVTLAAFILDNVLESTQVLFFRWQEAGATLKTNLQRCSIDQRSIADLGPLIRQKTADARSEFFGGVQKLQPASKG